MAKKKKRTTKKSPAKAPDFEASFAELRTVVTNLEQGNLTLSESMQQYEQGVQSLRSCYTALDDAKQKIELLINLDDEGRLITRPFDGSATEFAPGSSADREEEEDEDYIPSEDEIDDPNSLF